MRLSGKIALITGAGSGIGRACALAFSREGAKVALAGRNQHALDAVAEETGGLVVAGDVGKKSDAMRMVEQTVERFGGLSVLLNNAGYLAAGTAETHTEEEWETTFRTNVYAVWQLSRAALPHMRRAGGGSIINISSVLGLLGARNRAAYAASKGAVTMFTKSMALDHAGENIRVNCICPAIVDTNLVAPFVTQAPDPEAALRERIALHPLGRLGQPEDIAPFAVYLASDESSWVTGGAFPVDGGFTAR